MLFSFVSVITHYFFGPGVLFIYRLSIIKCWDNNVDDVTDNAEDICDQIIELVYSVNDSIQEYGDEDNRCSTNDWHGIQAENLAFEEELRIQSINYHRQITMIDTIASYYRIFDNSHSLIPFKLSFKSLFKLVLISKVFWNACRVYRGKSGCLY